MFTEKIILGLLSVLALCNLNLVGSTVFNSDNQTDEGGYTYLRGRNNASQVNVSLETVNLMPSSSVYVSWGESYTYDHGWYTIPLSSPLSRRAIRYVFDDNPLLVGDFVATSFNTDGLVNYRYSFRYVDDSYTSDVPQGQSIHLDGSKAVKQILFTFLENSVSTVHFAPMLVSGINAPSSFFEYGYWSDMYTNGYNVGYNQGINEGTLSSDYGVLTGSTLSDIDNSYLIGSTQWGMKNYEYAQANFTSTSSNLVVSWLDKMYCSIGSFKKLKFNVPIGVQYEAYFTAYDLGVTTVCSCSFKLDQNGYPCDFSPIGILPFNLSDELLINGIFFDGEDLAPFFSGGFSIYQDRGYSMIYEKGYSTGKQEGYDEGYTTAKNYFEDTSTTANAIFGGVLQIGALPLTVMLEMLNFEIFGVNLSGLVTGLVSTFVIVWLVRQCFGLFSKSGGDDGGKKDE